MIPQIYKVSDALTLRVCRTEKFKAGMLSLSAVLPIRRERVWLTSLLLSVLRRGTEKYPTLEAINRRLDYLYGTELGIRNFYRGDAQVIGFSAEYPEGAYLPAHQDMTRDVLDVMCQILFHPLLDDDGLLLSRYVESEKQMQCDAIRALKNNPRSYATEHARAVLYENEPCGAAIYGTVEEVEAVTVEALTAHWRELIDGIRLDCFYVGSLTDSYLCDALTDTVLPHLSSHAKGAGLPMPANIVRTVDSARRVEESLEVGQGQLILGFRTGCALGDDGYYACMVCNELLGASPISKLFVNVREKLSLCYHCSSSYQATKGTMTVHCGLLPINRARAEKAILAQIEALAAGDFDENELIGAKKSLLNAFRQLEDSPAALEGFYFGRAVAGVSDSLENCRARFDAVTRDEVIEAAKRLSLDTVYFLDALLGEEDVDDEDD